MEETPKLGVAYAAIRLLTFRLTSEELLALDERHLAFGLFATWVAGMGRYWDHPDAGLLQYMGVGSLIYVLVLTAILLGAVLPLRPENWTARRVLTLVTMTSPPAILYAIPVERFMDLGDAQMANMWFLAVVATWRVALLFYFLRRVAKLGWILVTVAALLPLALIVIALAVLNLEHVVFNIMGGMMGESTQSANDAAYGVVFGLSMLSFMAGPVLVMAWVVGIVVRSRTSRVNPPSDESDSERRVDAESPVGLGEEPLDP